MHFIPTNQNMLNYCTHQNTLIHYQTKGEGLPLVFIHGFCEDLSMWETFTKPLAITYQIITIDLPGFGHSHHLPDASIEDFADVVHTILKELNIPQCFIFGHSMGGYTALAFAEKYPNMLLGLSLFHSHPYADDEAKKTNRQRAINFIHRHGTVPFLGLMIPNLFAPDFTKNNKNLVDSLIDMASVYPPQGVITALLAMKNRTDKTTTLEKSTYPVLFIIGQQDSSIPYFNSLKMSYLPSVSMVCILENTGHNGMFEATEKCQAIIEEFVKWSAIVSSNLIIQTNGNI